MKNVKSTNPKLLSDEDIMRIQQQMMNDKKYKKAAKAQQKKGNLDFNFR